MGPLSPMAYPYSFHAQFPWNCVGVKTDPEEQYLFLRGMICGVEVTLANLYVPNSQQDHFITKMLDILLGFSRDQLILGGDLMSH